MNVSCLGRGVQADTCMARIWRGVWGVEGRGGLPVGRRSYGGHRADLWRASLIG